MDLSDERTQTKSKLRCFFVVVVVTGNRLHQFATNTKLRRTLQTPANAEGEETLKRGSDRKDNRQSILHWSLEAAVAKLGNQAHRISL